MTVLSCRGTGPILREQVSEFVVGMIGDSCEEVFEIGKGFDVMAFGRGDERVDDGGAFGALM